MMESDAALKYCKALRSCENMDQFRIFKSWYYRTREFNLSELNIYTINSLLIDKCASLICKNRGEKH